MDRITYYKETLFNDEVSSDDIKNNFVGLCGCRSDILNVIYSDVSKTLGEDAYRDVLKRHIEILNECFLYDDLLDGVFSMCLESSTSDIMKHVEDNLKMFKNTTKLETAIKLLVRAVDFKNVNHLYDLKTLKKISYIFDFESANYTKGVFKLAMEHDCSHLKLLGVYKYGNKRLVFDYVDMVRIVYTDTYEHREVAKKGQEVLPLDIFSMYFGKIEGLDDTLKLEKIVTIPDHLALAHSIDHYYRVSKDYELTIHLLRMVKGAIPNTEFYSMLPLVANEFLHIPFLIDVSKARDVLNYRKKTRSNILRDFAMYENYNKFCIDEMSLNLRKNYFSRDVAKLIMNMRDKINKESETEKTVWKHLKASLKRSDHRGNFLTSLDTYGVALQFKMIEKFDKEEDKKKFKDVFDFTIATYIHQAETFNNFFKKEPEIITRFLKGAYEGYDDSKLLSRINEIATPENLELFNKIYKEVK